VASDAETTDELANAPTEAPSDPLAHAPTVDNDPANAPTPAASDDELGSAASLLRGLADAPGAPVVRGPLRPGQRVAGKYEIGRAIGEGGMGVVYRARDVRLDRPVAIKIGSAVSPGALARMEREALALARLSHPNVVVVYEVGEVDGRVFVAMEYVEAGTARSWLSAAAKPRTAREILALYAAAGDGLAAAHAAGIVHRDFKPDNVLVGADGRPRVADFGLARAAEPSQSADPDTLRDPDADPDTLPDPSRTPAPLAELSHAGMVVGTPVYMSPEQLRGERVDARTDQFAFCASVWNALYAVRPFPGETPAQLRDAIESSEPRTSGPAGARTTPAGIPRHVELALRRGLRADPAARWPSMTALLAELRRDPARRRRNALLGAAVVASLASAVIVPLAMRGSAGPPAPCGDDDSALAPTWTDARADAVGRAFDATGAHTAWTALRPRIDRFAHGWIDAHHAACVATRVTGAQSEAILDRRMLCLDGARAQLDAVLADWTAGGRAAIGGAVDSIALLPDLAACADVATLAKETPLPADPGARAAIERAQGEIAEARIADIREDARDPIAVGDRALAAATASHWPPVIASASRIRAALLILGDRVTEGLAALERAANDALAAGDDSEAAWAMADLAWQLADKRRADDAARWHGLARAMWQRTGEHDGDLGIRLLAAEALIDVDRGQQNEGIAVAQRAQALTLQTHGNDPFDAAVAHYNVALVYRFADRWVEAANELRLATSGMEAVLGNEDPTTASFFGSLAEAETRIGRLDEAKADAQRSLDQLRAWYGDGVHTTGVWGLLGLVETARGDQAAARAAYDRELELLRATAPASPQIADVESNTGIVLASFGHFADAIPYAQRGLEGHIKIWGAQNPYIHRDYLLLGYAQRGLGKLADSEQNLRTAVHLVEAALGASEVEAVNPRIELSYTLVLEHKAAEAAALLAPMVALTEKSGQVAPPIAAELHMAYADAVWQAGGDRALARAQAGTARDMYAALGADYAAPRDHAAEWLRSHH
jgi:serine/threonine protein kinase/tetratricopeptide (TPR) repeat protein